MFCGIVETIGTVIKTKANGCKYLTICPDKPFENLALGESIAVNGVCLTVTAFQDNHFDVTVVPETLSVTTLENLTTSSKVNLERSISLGTRIGGHFIQGHVDCIGDIASIDPHENSDALLVKIMIPAKFSKYLVPKGFVAIDGMSITVIEVGNDFFTVTIIPHTQSVTKSQYYAVGEKVNIEVDILGKYIEKMLGERSYVRSN